MKGINKLCLQFLFYAGALVISLGLQISRPELFALFCTPLPITNFLSPSENLKLPLNNPVSPHTERIK
jgi:hypothetical protein